MRTLIVPILGITLLILSGCSSVWQKPGASEQEFYKDNAVCLAQCGQASGADGCTRTMSHVYESCMKGKGWREQKNY